jgi:hypothetical protein
MKRVLRNIALCLVVVASLALSSCTKQNGQPRQRKNKFQVVSLDKVSGSISEGWRITVTVANNTASNMRITDASAFVRQGGRKIARLTLDGDIFLPRRRCSQVDIPLRITLSNPIAAFSAFNKVRKGDFSGIAVDYSVTVSALASHRTIEGENVSLEQLAKQFNLGLKR